MTTLEQDLKARWTPSPRQDRVAAEYMAKWADRGVKEVYSIHLLVGKSHGWWTDDVTVEYASGYGVFETREEALKALESWAQEYHETTGKPVSGAYAWHRPVKPGEEPPTTADGTVWQTHWAVWEDICSEFPVPEWRQEARAVRAAEKAEGR